MASIINGTNIVLYRFDGTNNIPFAASTNCSISVSVNMFNMTTLTSLNYMEFTGGQITWGIDCDGMITIGDFDYKDMIILMQTKTQITVKFEIDNDNGSSVVLGKKVFTGLVNISSINLAGPMESVSTYSVNLQGTNNFTIS
jgi:hypothetical protein